MRNYAYKPEISGKELAELRGRCTVLRTVKGNSGWNFVVTSFILTVYDVNFTVIS